MPLALFKGTFAALQVNKVFMLVGYLRERVGH